MSLTSPECDVMSYRPPLVIAPEYSTLPLTDFMPIRSHVTSVTMMSPLTDPTSSPRDFTPFAVTLPLTLEADRSPSEAAPVSETLPETDLALSRRGVSDIVTLPLTVSARTAPCTFATLIAPEIDFASTPADDGTVMV